MIHPFKDTLLVHAYARPCVTLCQWSSLFSEGFNKLNFTWMVDFEVTKSTIYVKSPMLWWPCLQLLRKNKSFSGCHMSDTPLHPKQTCCMLLLTIQTSSAISTMF